MIALCGYTCCAPLNPHGTKDEIKLELRNTRAKAIILLAGEDGDDTAAGAAARELAAEGGRCRVLTLTARPLERGLFDLTERRPQGRAGPVAREPNRRGDEALVLHTSGTSGAKKIVPYTLDTLVTGAGCIMASWGLGTGPPGAASRPKHFPQ